MRGTSGGASPGSGPTRWSCPTRTTASTRRRSASAPATSPTSSAACGRWPASCARRRVVILEITTPTRPPLSTFFRVWFDTIVPALGRRRGDPDAYEYLPSSVKRFPAPEGLAAVMDRAGLRDIRWILTAGGIIAIHVGEA